jgi:hypothetical protein
MNLYIDKANLTSFMSQRDHMLYSDFIKLLKNQLTVYFNFKKQDIAQSSALSAFFLMSASGAGSGNLIFQEDASFPSRPLKSTSASEFVREKLSSVLLLDDSDIDKLKNAGSMIVGGVGEEIDIFRKVCLNLDDYLFDREFRIGSLNFNSWSDLKPYATPLTDILVIDPYTFKNSESERDTIDVNLIQWLGFLCEKSRVKVNVVIVYNPAHVDYDLDETRLKIIKSLDIILGKKPCVTFVGTVKEHDRTIITNYIRITGNTFNYWNSQGKKITKGKEIQIKSLGRREYFENAQAAVADIQEILDSNNGGVRITGDRESNFLSFG